jgi:hypothetical protein
MSDNWGGLEFFLVFVELTDWRWGVDLIFLLRFVILSEVFWFCTRRSGLDFFLWGVFCRTSFVADLEVLILGIWFVVFTLLLWVTFGCFFKVLRVLVGVLMVEEVGLVGVRGWVEVEVGVEGAEGVEEGVEEVEDLGVEGGVRLRMEVGMEREIGVEALREVLSELEMLRRVLMCVDLVGVVIDLFVVGVLFASSVFSF